MWISSFYFHYSVTGDDSLCGGNNWIAFEDEKCSKLIKQYTNYNDAESACSEERAQTESYLPRLVTIKTTAELNFLTDYVFNTSASKVDVWIGA
jgi:hypothetical protein